MKRRILFSGSVILLLACAPHPVSRRFAAATPSLSGVSATRPLVFERNSGQASAEYAAIARSSRVDAAFHPTGVALAVKDSATRSSAARALFFRGGSPVLPIEEGALAGRVHYLRGADARQWTTDVPTFERVRYKNVYPGIDAVFYGTDEQLEYDFVVAPRADPRAIALTFLGADSIRTDGGGDLIVSAAGHGMTQKRPVAYQEHDGRRRPVPVSYAIADDGAVRFAPAAANRNGAGRTTATAPASSGRPSASRPPAATPWRCRSARTASRSISSSCRRGNISAPRRAR